MRMDSAQSGRANDAVRALADAEMKERPQTESPSRTQRALRWIAFGVGLLH
jgi:hypothetical protein